MYEVLNKPMMNIQQQIIINLRRYSSFILQVNSEFVLRGLNIASNIYAHTFKTITYT